MFTNFKNLSSKRPLLSFTHTVSFHIRYKYLVFALLILSEEIYSCEHTFERIFLGACFGSNAPHFIAGWKSDFKDQVNEIILFSQNESR